MQSENKSLTQPDYQDPGVKKAKRIASVIYVLVMAFIVGGSYWHQQTQPASPGETTEFSGFSNP